MGKREYEHTYADQDQYFDLSEEYYELSEHFTYHQGEIGEDEYTTIKDHLQKLIKKEPDYLDPYLLLFDIYQFQNKDTWADKILNIAYQRALALIIDKKGNWPDTMEWGWLENRPVIRTLLKKAEQLWHVGNMDKASWKEAYDIYSNLLKTNPEDNTGGRYNLLAMLEGMTFNTYYDRFIGWDDYAGEIFKPELEEWFREHLPKHKELAWWIEYANEREWLS